MGGVCPHVMEQKAWDSLSEPHSYEIHREMPSFLLTTDTDAHTGSGPGAGKERDMAHRGQRSPASPETQKSKLERGHIHPIDKT